MTIFFLNTICRSKPGHVIQIRPVKLVAPCSLAFPEQGTIRQSPDSAVALRGEPPGIDTGDDG